MNYKTLFGLLLILAVGNVLLVTPSHSWVGPPYNGPWPTEDGKFESFGPRVDVAEIYMFPNDYSEWQAFVSGSLAFMERPLKGDEYNWIVQHPELFAIAEYNSTGMFWLDLNNAEWTNDNENDIIGDPGDVRNPLGDPTLILLPPSHPWLPMRYVARGSQLRLAIALLIDRDAIIAMSGMRLLPLWTHLPETFRPGTWIVDAFAGYPYSPSLAAMILDMAGFVDTDGDGWRNFDSDGDGDIDANDKNIDLKFYTRTDPFRTTLGDWMQTNLLALNIKVTRIPVASEMQAWQYVVLHKKHNMYTPGWRWDSRQPTIHYTCFHSSKYWHPGDCPNYNRVNDLILDEHSVSVMYALNLQEAKDACHACQIRMAEPDAVYNIPIATGPIEAKGYKKYYVPPEMDGEYWLGFVNTVGRGINTGALISDSSAGQSSIDTLLNAHGALHPAGGTISYGWRYTWMPTSLNPFYYNWDYDKEIIFRIYDCLLAVNPYNPIIGDVGFPPSDIPWIAKKWKIEPDPFAERVKVTFWLRDDVYFHDGVTKLTAKDVYYTVQLGHWIAIDHPEYGWIGLAPTWWYCIKDITPEYDEGDTPGVGVDMPDGPDGYKIVFNYNVQCLWALWWAGSIPIVPKHKWWDIFYPDPTGVDGFAPDPTMMGTGPFKIFPYSVDPPHPIVYQPGAYFRMFKNNGFHHSYVPGAESLSVSFASNALDIYINNPTTNSLVVSLLVYINDSCWKVSNIKVPRNSYGLTLIQGLIPGAYNVLAIIEQYHVMNWTIISISPEQPHPAADIAGSTVKYRRLPRDLRVNYMDTFWFGKTFGQVISEDP